MRFYEHVTVSASSAKLASFTQDPVFSQPGLAAVVYYIDVTAESATASVVPTIEALDETSGVWVVILTATAITATTGDVRLEVGNVFGVANLASHRPLRQVRIVMTAADADDLTYSIGADIYVE